VLAHNQNVVKETDDYVKIQYASERGIWKATYSKAHNKIIILDRETTIENIVDWVVEKHLGTLMMGHVKRLFVSEGLSKGAVREFSV
jgi:hypothetical protein